MNSFDPGGIPCSNSGFLFFPFIQAGGKNVPSELQQAIMVIVSPFLVDVTVEKALEPFGSKYVPRTTV